MFAQTRDKNMTSATQQSVDQYSAATDNSDKIQSRRVHWVLGFGLFSALLMTSAPTFGNLLAVVVGLSMSCWAWGSNTTHLDSRNNIIGTILGGMLNAGILGTSIVAGHHLVLLAGFDMHGLVIAFGTVFGFVIYCALTGLEALINLGVQLIVTRNCSSELKIAYQIDVRFGGFLGEINR